MELKYQRTLRFVHQHQVLIVPLWNWNKEKAAAIAQAYGSNRTFMELKSDFFANYAA